MEAEKKSGEKKKCAKAGRNKAACLAYKSGQRREMNKARRLRRHLRKHPLHQDSAWKAMEELGRVLYAKQKADLGYNELMAMRP